MSAEHPVGAERLAEAEDRILACVHCGFCLSACPTYTRLGDESDSPRGRIYLMRAVAEGRLAPDDQAFQTHIDRCLGCRACEPVCPSGVQYGFLLERARATIADAVGSSLPTRVILWTFGHNLASNLLGVFSRAFRATGVPRLLVRWLPRSLPRIRLALAMLAATSPWRGLRRVPASPDRTALPAPPRNRRPVVALLDGCAQSAFFDHVNHATRVVLEANHCAVLRVSGQGCCGALHAHSGQLDRARDLARRNIAAFEASGAEQVVVNAAGCGAIMKEYGELLEGEPEWHARARRFSASVCDLNEFLAEIGIAKGGTLPLRVTYDAPCHLLHAQRIARAPLDVMDKIPGLEMLPLPHSDECCGGAGIYGLLHEELGGHILGDKIQAILATGAQVVVTPNPGCMMQIGAGLLLAGSEVRVLHPVELLAESYHRRKAT